MTKTNKTVFGWPGIAVLTLAMGLTVTGCSEQTAQQYVQSGKARMTKKDYKGAAIEFKNALSKDSASAEARFFLGKALLESGEPRSAWLELNKARDGGYSKDELSPVMATTLLALGLTDKFIADFADVQLATPVRQAELKAALSMAYGSKGKYADARIAAEAAVAADPNNIAARVSIAWLSMVNGDKSGALAQVDELIKAHPEAVNGWAARAEMVLAAQGDPADALAAYREALRLQPDALDAHLGIIKLLWRQQDYAGVENQLAQLNKARPNNIDHRYYQGLLAFERKDLKNAREVSQLLLKAAPENARFLHLAGMVEYERGNYAQAIAHLSKAAPSSLSPPAVRVLLARAYLRAGDPRKALNALQPLLEKDESKVPAEVYAAAGDAYTQLGDAAAARRMQQLAVKSNPADVRSRAALALSDINQGRTNEGLSALQSIADADKSAAKGVEAELLLFVAHIRAGRLDDAEKVAEAVNRKLPDHPAGAYLRAQVEQRRGQPDKARESLELALKRSASYAPAAFELARVDLASGRPAQAAQRFERLVAADPKSVNAALALIAARALAGAPREEIRAQSDAVVKKFPEDEAPRLALVQLLLDQRDYPAAVAAASEGLARIPDSVRLQDLVGVTELAVGNLSRAAAAFNKTAAQQPQAMQPLMRLVDVELARKDVPAAIGQLKRALAVKPDDLPAQAMLVRLLSRSGKTDEALAQAKTVQARSPQSSVGWLLEGDLLSSKLKFPESAAAYRTAQQKQPDGTTAARLHRSLLKAGQTSEAAKFQAQWLSQKPDDPDFQYYLGSEALRQQQYDAAEKAYRKVLAARPNDPVSLNNLAWLLHHAGKPGALANVQQALAGAPNSAALLDTAAEIYLAAGQLDKALELQSRAVKIEPDQPLHRLHLAQYLAQSGKNTEARQELEKLSELGMGFSGQDEVQKLLASLK